MQYTMLQDPYLTLSREDEERRAAQVGVELRRPFWTTAMVQFAFSTPERVRLEGLTDRALHRRATSALLPRAVIERRQQADFMIAFRRHGEALRQMLFDGSLPDWQGWVIREMIEEKYAQFGNKMHLGRPEWLLWSLFGCAALAADAR